MSYKLWPAASACFCPPHEVVVLPQPIDGYPSAPAGGDWRQATTNVSYHDELERHLNGKKFALRPTLT